MTITFCLAAEQNLISLDAGQMTARWADRYLLGTHIFLPVEGKHMIRNKKADMERCDLTSVDSEETSFDTVATRSLTVNSELPLHA